MPWVPACLTPRAVPKAGASYVATHVNAVLVCEDGRVGRRATPKAIVWEGKLGEYMPITDQDEQRRAKDRKPPKRGKPASPTSETTPPSAPKQRRILNCEIYEIEDSSSSDSEAAVVNKRTSMKSTQNSDTKADALKK
eukprot:Gregarina_sp_Poly_1__6742@NODE_3631_length_966_cov_56_835373_g2313_i0_p1_GENE_NODE_3631_length_966_cov_56_835373_g2313_i0NODE_3631_length_966_cov_56_835373_g2313_i0_p1_ORF_typecomplete_len138_score17_15_NODE_3631_length_966_cov_56_835373_g2313_i0497910